MCCGLEGSNEWGRKHGNMKHTVVPNIALWSVVFQGIVLLNVVAQSKNASSEKDCSPFSHD
jgi:hypothetical protein